MSMIAIWNLALGHVGDKATVVSADERSRQAELCRMFWPMTRRSALSAHPWSISTRIKALSPAPTGTPTAGWLYAFSGVPESIRDIAVGIPGPGGWAGFQKLDYQKMSDDAGNAILLANIEAPYLLFCVDNEDTATWPPLLVEAATWLLASHLAGPLITGDEGRAEGRRLLEEFRLAVARAAQLDANEQRLATMFDFRPSALRDRTPPREDLNLTNMRV